MEHDLFGKPVATFPDHAVLMEHDLFGKPVATFPDHAVLMEHDLFGKPVATFPDHAQSASNVRRAEQRAVLITSARSEKLKYLQALGARLHAGGR
jgi:hypothetical protein